MSGRAHARHEAASSAAPRREPGQGVELERVRAALARGERLSQALEEHTHPATGRAGVAALRERVRADVDGAGPRLQPFLDLPGVTDVLVGGGSVWIDRGAGLERVSQGLAEEEVRALAVRMAAAAGRRLDDASPVADATLADGTRLCAVLPPLSRDGTLICLRTRRRRAFTLTQLVQAGSVSPPMDEVLAGLVASRASCLVTGATGTGKTTLLATLLGLVPHEERIVCIEEASELAPDHPHVVHLQERGANVQGMGQVSMTDLVRTALRMRPDRLVLGECRGPEVREVLTALNTGHEGGWATLHANSPADVPARLAALGALAGMSESAVAAQAASALDAVIHLRRVRAGAGRQRRWVRVVEQVGVLHRDEGSGRLVCLTALRRGLDGRVEAAEGAGALERLLERGQGCAGGTRGVGRAGAAGHGVEEGCAGTAGTPQALGSRAGGRKGRHGY